MVTTSVGYWFKTVSKDGLCCRVSLDLQSSPYSIMALPFCKLCSYARKGLGKNDQGQVDPLEIVILPAGKSLDVCAEMREAKKLRKPLGQVTTKRRRKRKRNLETGLQQQFEQQVHFVRIDCYAHHWLHQEIRIYFSLVYTPVLVSQAIPFAERERERERVVS